jgi:ribosome-associated protein
MIVSHQSNRRWRSPVNVLAMDDLVVTSEVVIPAAELIVRFDTSGGPGGQHANRSSTRVELSFDVSASAVLDATTRERLLGHPSIENGIARVQVGESRSQWRNRQLARRRLAELLAEALRPPPPTRKRTRPGRAARERRLREKRARSEKKQLRRPPEQE